MNKLANTIVAMIMAPLLAQCMIPSDAVQRISEMLPATISPVPARPMPKIYPMVSKTNHNLDRTNPVALDGSNACVLTAISDDGKFVELAVDSKTTRKFWFNADDVFGGIKWQVADYEPAAQCLIYDLVDKKNLDLKACVEGGTKCIALGNALVDRKTYRYIIAPCAEFTSAGESCSHRIAFAREAPPVKSKAEYNVRAKEFDAEYAYREGRVWENSTRSMLTDESSFACAGLCTDFAKYVFGAGLLYSRGEEYKNPNDIRDGDIIHIEHHYLVVLHRKGSMLETVEGNMNAMMSHSRKRYSLVGGKVLFNGKNAAFDYGLHYAQFE